MQHSQGAKWTTGAAVHHQGDQVPVQDQESSPCFMLSAQELTSCLQMSTPCMVNPSALQLGPAQPNTTMWLQDTPCQQPGLLLTHNSADAGMWGLQQQATVATSSAQLQLLQGDAGGAYTSLASVSAGLQDTGSLMSLLPAHASTDLSGMQTASLSGQQLSQPLQQVFVTASGEHVLLVGDGPQQQQAVAAGSTCHTSEPTAASGNEAVLQAQIQQLQEAVQRLSCENAAVQQAILNTQANQAQVAPKTAALSLEGPATATSSSTAALQPDTPVLAASLSNASPPGSFCGHDSLGSSSWHCLDSLSSNNSSPCFAGRSRLVQGAVHVPASHLHGASVVHVLRAPDVPQQAPAGNGMGFISISAHGGPAPTGGMGHGPGLAAAGGCAGPTQGMVVYSQTGWTASGAPTYAPVAAAAPPGSLAAHSISYAQQQGGCISSMGAPIMLVASNNSQQPAGRLGGMQPYSMQKPFRGNKPFGPLKSRAAGKPSSVAAGKPPAASGSQPADGAATPATSTRSIPAGPWADVTLEEGLKQLWSAEQLSGSKGGRLFNVQQLAWHPVGEPDPCAQDMYNFQKLKRMVQKLDAVHKARVRLIKRIHAVADHGACDLKAVYREVRALIGEMLHDSAMQIKSMEECRVTGLVRLALMLQEALKLGPQQADASSA